MNILTNGREVNNLILQHLSDHDLINFSLTCKQFNEFCSSINTNLWLNRIILKFGKYLTEKLELKTKTYTPDHKYIYQTPSLKSVIVKIKQPRTLKDHLIKSGKTNWKEYYIHLITWVYRQDPHYSSAIAREHKWYDILLLLKHARRVDNVTRIKTLRTDNSLSSIRYFNAEETEEYGTCKKWYTNNQLGEVIDYKNDLYHGEWKKWGLDGKFRFIRKFHEGNLIANYERRKDGFALKLCTPLFVFKNRHLDNREFMQHKYTLEELRKLSVEVLHLHIDKEIDQHFLTSLGAKFEFE